MLFVPYRNITNIDDIESIKEVLQSIESNSISCINWPGQFPYKPEVSFKIMHNNDCIFLQYFVMENEIMALVAEDNGPVSTDSCVEFFMLLNDESYYYNAEFSCIGKTLLAFRKERQGAVRADSSIIRQIKKFPSLGADPIEKKQGEFQWDLLVAIPVTAYWNSGLKSFKGLKAKGNFYKCGDGLTTPHYLSWKPIFTEKPDFHTPQFFCDIEFK